MYDIEAKVVLNTGEMIDISPVIRQFTFIQSFKTRFPIYKLLISNQTLKFINSNFEYFYFNIKYKAHDLNEYESYSFYAKPITSAFQIYFTSFTQEEPYRDYVWLNLIDYTLYKVIAKKHKAKIYRHTTLIDIVKQYLDNLQYDDTINQTVYDEIYIPTMSYDALLDYLNYHFGFYKTNSAILYRWNPKNLEYNIVIQDNTLLDKYDIILYKIDNDDDLKEILKQEAENLDKLIVTPSPLIFDNKLPESIISNEFAIIGKPLDKLYDKLVINIEDYLNTYCPVTDNIDLQESNVSMLPDNVLNIRTHNRIDSVTSLLSNEYLVSTCKFEMDNPRIRILAGHKVNVNITTPDLTKFTGTYIAEVVKYDWILSDGNWKCANTNILVRTNPFKSGV